MANYIFTIVSCKLSWFLNFHVSHLNHETFKLCLQNTLNMSKTTRVYFGMLHTLGEPPFPLNKGKGRIGEIKYPGGSEYLKSAVQNALAVGPSKVGPLCGATFARRYRPPFGVWVWSLDVLTSYVVQVPKMVCLFEVAFDNGLRFPLQPFIKWVLQHFNVCPSQLAPNF